MMYPRFVFPLLLLLTAVACSTLRSGRKIPAFAANPVIAHRGAFKAAGLPENSIAALKEAIRLQCTGSDFDVHMTADDSLIVNHDPQYHNQVIEKTTFAELARFPLANGEPLPTLQQYLEAGLQNNTSTRLVLEIKPSGISKDRGRLIATRVVQLVQQLKAAPMIVYISFDFDILLQLKQLDRTTVTQYLAGNKSPQELKAAGIEGADYHISVFRKHPEWIKEAREAGIVLNTWTVNDPADMDWLLQEGFPFITTNEPALLLQRFKARQ